MIVPKDLRKLVGKTELRYSLKTGYLGVAKHKARLIAGQIQLAFRILRKGGLILSKLSDDQIQALVNRYIKDWLEGLDTRLYEEDAIPPPFIDYKSFRGYIESLDDVREQIIVNMHLGEFFTLENPIDDLLKKNGINQIDKDSMEYKKLCVEIHKAAIDLLPIEQKHMLGDFSYKGQLSEIFPEAFPQTSKTPPVTDDQKFQKLSEVDKGERISEVIKHYVAENEKSNWTVKTKQEIESSLNLFVEVVGDIPIRSVTRRQISEFKDTLQKLPPNMNKVKKYRDKSVKELLEMDIKKTLSINTINKTLTRVSTLFNHALKNGFIEGVNPASDMNLPKDKAEDEYRAAFTKEELEKLFRSPQYLDDDHQKSYQFWIPILALFAGMRQDEIAQLHLDDIRQDEEGIWIIDINDKAEKKLKTKSAKRLVPLHRFIIDELKLHKYIEYLKGQGEKRIFPELKKGRDGYSQAVSKWFNTSYKKKCGIVEEGRKKDFHSFRTTFITHLEHKGVPYLKLKQTTGHSKGKDTTLTYIEKYTPKQLLDDVISKIDYGIDLSHLKNSKWVPR
jgi:integrase